ncbi:hypothetical protein LIER_23887 [Lithospermum erythrorhizon]|uniref:Uncharacterized protein n=1 Tax=Lithospermum erythrorhizon TaxID=34254 RepID=A0AAV3R2V5_LITER
MDILEGACVMTIVETVGLYRTKLVKRVIYNLNDDDSNNGKVHNGEKGNMVVNEITDTAKIIIPSVGVTTGKEKTIADHSDILNYVDPSVDNIANEFWNVTRTRIAERGIKNGGAEPVVQPTAIVSWHLEDEFRASGKSIFAVIRKWLASTDIVNGRRSSKKSISCNISHVPTTEIIEVSGEAPRRMMQGVTQNCTNVGTNITDSHDDTGQSEQNTHKVVKDTVA